MLQLRIMRPSIVCGSEQLNLQCSQHICHTPISSKYDLIKLICKVDFNFEKVTIFINWYSAEKSANV